MGRSGQHGEGGGHGGVRQAAQQVLHPVRALRHLAQDREGGAGEETVLHKSDLDQTRSKRHAQLCLLKLVIIRAHTLSLKVSFQYSIPNIMRCCLQHGILRQNKAVYNQTISE